jgi:hypothetical protein
MIAERHHLAYSQLALSSATAAGIAVLCVLPPILHFISGPLGPLIGGAIVGTRRRLLARDGLLVGLGMGAIFGALAILGVALASQWSPGLIASSSPLGLSAAWLIPVLVWAYVSLLGCSGAVIGGYLGRKEADSRTEA